MRILPSLISILLTTSCSSLFYHPTDTIYVRGPELEKVREKVEFKNASGGSLSGWYFKNQNGRAAKGTVIQFHGNAENLTSHFMSLYWMTKEGYHLFSFDYRGYGSSPGEPNQKGLNEDALAAIRYILGRQVPRSSEADVILYGQSLGGAVLLRAYDDVTPTERLRIQSLVIESSFHNYRSIAADVLSRSALTWLFQPLGYLLISNAYSPEDSIARASPTPILVLHGDKDQVVPLRFGEIIFSLAQNPKKILIVPGAGHIACMAVENGKYQKELLEFIDQTKNTYPAMSPE
jgi:uncharacterized protein